jgi:putative membrane protein
VLDLLGYHVGGPGKDSVCCFILRRASLAATSKHGALKRMQTSPRNRDTCMSIIVRDALLHFAHFVCIFLLACLLAGEAFLLKKSLPREGVAQLQGIDRYYGIAAGLVIVTGLLLVFFGAKGPAYYAHNAIFWMKMALFVSVALISIAPTVAFLRWNQRRTVDGSIMLDDREYRRLRALLWAEIGLFVFIPLCAALMANGISI